MRDVRLPWSCHQTADCCQGPDLVVTPQERDALVRVRPESATWTWRPHHTPPFLVLIASPCRFLSGTTCTVYDVRPYNCRRFICLRPDPVAEPLETGGPLGCYNASERVLANRQARRFYQLHQRKAQRWADSHGWRR